MASPLLFKRIYSSGNIPADDAVAKMKMHHPADPSLGLILQPWGGFIQERTQTHKIHTYIG